MLVDGRAGPCGTCGGCAEVVVLLAGQADGAGSVSLVVR